MLIRRGDLGSFHSACSAVLVVSPLLFGPRSLFFFFSLNWIYKFCAGSLLTHLAKRPHRISATWLLMFYNLSQIVLHWNFSLSAKLEMFKFTKVFQMFLLWIYCVVYWGCTTHLCSFVLINLFAIVKMDWETMLNIHLKKLLRYMLNWAKN